jgi:hypothetical protein
MKLAKIGLTAVVAVAVITVGMVRLARAAVIFNGDVPIVASVVNECNGETVVLSGVGHEVIDQTVSTSGNLHFSTHFNGQGVSGVGLTTGAKYSLSNSVNEQETLAGASEETINQTYDVIGQGQVPNFVVHSLLHITVNANGTVTAFVDNFTSTCH